jgi:hypothetical protein
VTAQRYLVDRALMVEILARRRFLGAAPGATLFEQLAEAGSSTLFIVDASNISAFVGMTSELVSPRLKFDFMLYGHNDASVDEAIGRLARDAMADEDVRIESSNYDLVRGGASGSPSANIEYCLWLALVAASRGATMLCYPKRWSLLRAVLLALGYADRTGRSERLSGLTRFRHSAPPPPLTASLTGYVPAAVRPSSQPAEKESAADKAEDDVFISYDRADRPLAEALAHDLSGAGASVWWDPRVTALDRFRDVIQAKLNSVRAVIVLWTEHSVLSNFVRDEAQVALSLGKLVSLRAEEIRPADIPIGFREQLAPLVSEQNKIHEALRLLGVPVRS